VRVLLVLGHGVAAGSVQRVRAAADYVAAAGAPSRIVFTGGWPLGAAPPPDGCREADLMVAAARALGLDGDLRVECRSRTTLENLLNTVEDGLLAGFSFTGDAPLGIVSHRWHLPRVRYLAGKVLGLRGPALLDVPVDGPPAGGLHEYALRAATRLYFAGARDAATLLRRERLMGWSAGRRS
jgi:hypothetical protein